MYRKSEKRLTPSSEARDKEFILNQARDLDVRFIRMRFTDILGFLKSFAIFSEDLKAALFEGHLFDGSAIEGLARIEESDMFALPDPATFCALPWRPKEGGVVARMFCDINRPDGSPYPADPRYVLRRALEKRPPPKASPFTSVPNSNITISDRQSRPWKSSTGEDTSTSPRSTSPAISGGTRFSLSKAWESAWSTATTRWAPASTKSAL